VRLATTIFVVCVWTTVAAQSALDSIRALYASADYEGVLAAVDRLPPDERSKNLVSVDLLRILCLTALGRPSEATPLIEGILTIDPFYDPASADVPPRIRSTFSDVRRRLLPRIARVMYLDAKATFDNKSYLEAIDKFERVRRLSAHPDAKGDPDLADLATVADGFLELSRAALPQPAAPPEPSPPTTPEKPAPPAGKSLASAPLTPPIAIRQDMPAWTQTLSGAQSAVELRGSVEVDIDADGTVVAARMVQSVHVAYDKLLLDAARNWKYEPARRGGEAIPATKRVDVVLRPRD
jgi:TonB family protein